MSKLLEDEDNKKKTNFKNFNHTNSITHKQLKNNLSLSESFLNLNNKTNDPNDLKQYLIKHIEINSLNIKGFKKDLLIIVNKIISHVIITNKSDYKEEEKNKILEDQH